MVPQFSEIEKRLRKSPHNADRESIFTALMHPNPKEALH
jgi:hypothetical protein